MLQRPYCRNGIEQDKNKNITIAIKILRGPIPMPSAPPHWPVLCQHLELSPPLHHHGSVGHCSASQVREPTSSFSLYKIATEGEKSIPPTWHIESFKMVVFKKQQMWEALKIEQKLIFQETLQLIRKISICQGTSLTIPGRGEFLCLQKLLSMEKAGT